MGPDSRPLIGAIVGVIVYDLFVGDILHARLLRAATIGTQSGRPPGPDTLEPPIPGH